MPSLLPKILIRQAARSDLPALEWDGAYIHFRRMFADTYRQCEKGDAVMWVADLPQVGIIGQVFIQLNGSHGDLADSMTCAYMFAFRVRPPYRRHGIGTRLLQIVEADLIQRGFQCILLNVARNNAVARRLYERLGYRVVCAEPGDWSYIDHRGRRRHVHEPAWRMEKIL